MHPVLSSCNFGNPNAQSDILKNLKKPAHQCKVLFSPNEKATPEIIHSEKYYTWMQQRGFS